MNVELYTPLRPSATAEINGRNEKGIRTGYSLVKNNECHLPFLEPKMFKDARSYRTKTVENLRIRKMLTILKIGVK